MSSFIYFVLGVAVSIPVSMFAPNWTVRWQQWQGRRDQLAAKRRREQIEAELAEVRELKEDVGALLTFFFTRLVVLAFISAAASLVQGVFGALAQYASLVADVTFTRFYMSFAIQNLYGVASLALAVSSAVTAQICVRCLRMARKVRNFEQFQEHAMAQLAELVRPEAEGTAPAAPPTR